VSLAHLAGIAGVLYLAHRRGQRLEPFVDLIFVVLFAGLLGGRLGYWAEHRHEITSWGEFLRLDHGGLSFFGGLALAFPAYLSFLRWRGFPVWKTSDLLAPVLPFSLGILRLGCFGAGCCYGAPTELPWGIHPDTAALPASLQGMALHPSPLYESAFLFSLTALLMILNARGKLRPGLVASLCMGAYGLYRFTFDFFRGDLTRPIFGIFSASQALGLLLALLAAGTAAYVLRTRANSGA
jgi:phosphatidylglycerol:prolipoprotein diacylglycerol transferase